MTTGASVMATGASVMATGASVMVTGSSAIATGASVGLKVGYTVGYTVGCIVTTVGLEVTAVFVGTSVSIGSAVVTPIVGAVVFIFGSSVTLVTTN